MSNGNDNTLLLAGLTVAAIVGFYLYTEPSASSDVPLPPPPPQPGGGQGPSAVSPMPPFPVPKGYLDVGMDASTALALNNELLADNDVASLDDFASLLASKGFTSSAAAVEAKIFMLQQPDPTAIMIAMQTPPSPITSVVYTQPDPQPVIGKTYHVATSSGLEFWSDPGPASASPAMPTSFTPVIQVPFGQGVIASGQSIGVIWQVLLMGSDGIPRLGWINSLGLT
ncbi:MAG: hypothetical protein ACYDH4_10665 [Candidatus Cryosericum sp.]